MTDDKSRLGEPVGEPVEEPRPVDDVLVRANEGLADAEAAGADAAAASDDEDAAFAARYAGFTNGDAVAEPIAAEETVVVESVAVAPSAEAAVDASTEAFVTPSEPVAEAAPVVPVVVVPSAVQPIFVQAPLPPRSRGNRGVGALIGLLAAASFAALYLGAYLGFGLITGDITTATLGAAAQGALTSAWLWVTTAVFYIALLIFVAIANRARWGYYVIFGLLVGLASYGGHLLGQLFQAPFWSLTASQGVALMESQLVAPLAFVAFVIGRELTIWFGAWIAMHGRRATEYNREALLEYERTLEAGPTLTRV